MRNTIEKPRGTCPVCIEKVPAEVIEDEGCVYLVKDCPEHGRTRSLLSRHPVYFKNLRKIYFDLLPDSLPQRDFILRLTGRCNMKCPICLADADDYPEKDLSLSEIMEFVESRGPGTLKLDLMGAEPTLHGEIVDIVRTLHQKGHITALHTNGMKIQDESFLRELKEAGLNEVHLQCDGLDAACDEVLRGRPMQEVRRSALAALEHCEVATDLVVTVLRGINENAILEMLEYAAGHDFVKEVFFLGCRRLGRATDDFAKRAMAPDELIDLLQTQSLGWINRDDIRIFQKLYFVLLAIFKVRKCFYIHHYLVLRHGSGYRPVSQYLDLNYLEPRLDRFVRLFRRSRYLAVPYLFIHGLIGILRKKGFPLLYEASILTLILMLGFDLSRIKKKSILLGFITACDPWNHDEMVAANCGKGELSTDLGSLDAGAEANIRRERNHRSADAESAEP